MSRWLALLFMLALVLGATGCVHPLGTNDVALDMRVLGNGDVDKAALRVRSRLRAAHISASVTPIGARELRIVLDGANVAAAERTLLRPHDFEIRAVEDGVVRTEGPPLLVIPNNEASARGKSVVFHVRDPHALGDLAHRRGDKPVAVMEGGAKIWRGRLSDAIDSGDLVVPWGSDVRAYSRARRGAMLFILAAPPLETVHKTPLPADWLLAIGSTLVALLVGVFWIVGIRRFDRLKPEPLWLVGATFLFGVLSGEAALRIEGALSDLSPYLDTSVMSLDASAGSFPITLLVYVVCVGVVEEGVKVLAGWSLAMHRREFDEPIDGIIYMGAAAIGFAVHENISYFWHYRFGESMVVARSLVPLHPLFSGIVGHALGQRLVGRKGRVLVSFAIVALLHGAYDASLVYGWEVVADIVLAVTIVLFIRRVRDALRWGSTAETQGEGPASVARTYVRVGRPFAFAAAIVTMLVIGALFNARAVFDQYHGGDMDLARVVVLGAFVTIFAAAMVFTTRTLPLDVVIDALGVTFAGGLFRWSEVTGFARSGSYVALSTSRGEIALGPARDPTLDRLEAALRDAKR